MKRTQNEPSLIFPYADLIDKYHKKKTRDKVKRKMIETNLAYFHSALSNKSEDRIMDGSKEIERSV